MTSQTRFLVLVVSLLAIAGCNSGGPETNTSPSVSGPGQELLRAAATALAKVPDSRIAEIERGDDDRGATDTWQVHALGPDGTAHELMVSADGATVVEGPTARPGGSSKQYFRLLESASVDYRKAFDIMLARSPGGTSLARVELRFEGADPQQVKDAKRGSPPETWSSSVSNGYPIWVTSDGTHSVVIDATTGEVLA